MNCADTTYKLKQAKIAKYRKELLIRQTKAEVEFGLILKELKIKYIPQKGFISRSGKYIVDFYLPKPYKLCIEIDGSSHIGKELYDLKRTKYLTIDRRFKILRISNEEVYNKDYIISLLKVNSII